MYEVSFRMLHEGCPFADISRRYDATIVQWCNGATDIFEIRGEDSENLQRIAAEFRKLSHDLGKPRLRVTNFQGERPGLIVQELSGCMCRRAFKSLGVRSIGQAIRRNKCIDVPPAIYKAGWEHYTFLSFDPSDLKNLFATLQKLGRLEVVSKRTYSGTARESFTISLRGLFSGLTPKQVDAYLSALDGGYYAIPRRTTIGKIARTRGFARTTYDEHLRKAESKVALAIAPYLRIYEAGS